MHPLVRAAILVGLLAVGIAGARVGLDDSSSSAPPAPSPAPSPATPTPTTDRPVDPPSKPPKPDLRARCGSEDAARTITYRTTVDTSLDIKNVTFARGVRDVLCHERSWIASGAVNFAYDPKGDLLIALATPARAESRCLELINLSVNSFYSCATAGEIILNADRWFEGSPYWPGEVPRYRRMLVNHEVGHALGQRHSFCDAPGDPAPVMMQQSKGLDLNGTPCEANPWPLPDELAAL